MMCCPEARTLRAILGIRRSQTTSVFLAMPRLEDESDEACLLGDVVERLAACSKDGRSFWILVP